MMGIKGRKIQDPLSAITDIPGDYDAREADGHGARTGSKKTQGSRAPTYAEHTRLLQKVSRQRIARLEY
jgi:hypothetical protein